MISWRLGIWPIWCANRINGDNTYFIYNQHINYSNICINLCKFCAFGKEKESELAYEMSCG